MENEIIRFWNHVDKKESDKCWNWTAATDRRGYGLFHAKEGMIRAHRFSWMIHSSLSPHNYFVCHKCDNPSCVNPNHLFVGTPQENQSDMRDKGRSLSGERNGNSKITNEEAKRIRALAFFGMQQRKIAKEFNISKTQVARIVHKKCFHNPQFKMHDIDG